MNARKLLSAAKAVEAAYIEDVFSTYLYTGNGSTQTITNGIDLSGKGGMVWIKSRSAATGHRLTDTARGATKALESNSTAAEVTESTGLTAFGTTGFTIGADADYNTNAATYVSWTFREQAKFFDVATFTSDGSGGATVSHNLGSTPGAIFIKRLDASGGQNWLVYHRSLTTPTNYYLALNTTDPQTNFGSAWISVSSSSITISGALNASSTYVAYLFAHDAGGFGASGSENVISCGSYTEPGSGFIDVNLGWEPQYILLKNTTATSGWFVFDTLRGWTSWPTQVPSGTGANYLYANTSGVEAVTGGLVAPTATGFQAGAFFGGAWIYIAIRRGPMKTPTTGTSVYTSASRTGTASVIPRFTSNFVVDWALRKSDVTAGGGDWQAGDRLRGGVQVKPNLTEAETAAATLYTFDSMTGYSTLGAVGSDTADRSWMFRRAPGFFDVVCVTGTGAGATYSHNLGAVPELMIQHGRSIATDWECFTPLGKDYAGPQLNKTNAASASANYWTAPTATTFKLQSSIDVNTSTYVAYLFASCPGVSKVFSYTGNGSSQTINCGFTGGARFVLIKRTDSTGDWYVWDSARGIVAGNDPHLSLNSTAAEVTTDDSVDTDSTGFVVNQLAATNVNVNAATYIGIAVA